MGNLILIGFMGAGKTTVGKRLAAENGMKFVDTDERIVLEQQMEIPRIFSEKGEPFFRDLETDLLKRMQTDTSDSVVSVGGGMPVREENQKLLRSLGQVIYLCAEKETILSRVKGDGSRPLLAGDDLEKKVTSLMAAREDIYLKTAHVVIHTDGMDVDGVVKKIQDYS